MNSLDLNSNITIEVANSTLARIVVACLLIFILFFGVKKLMN